MAKTRITYTERTYPDRMSYSARKPYGCMSFIFDVFMTFLTGGIWLIWIFVREMRNR